jgi:UDP-N-acetyl-2-amino-2-deoxyglucuronate dehydrogenase
VSEGKTIGFGVVGFGHMGRRHARLIQEHPEARLVAIADMQQPTGPLPAPFFSGFDAMLTSSLAKEIDVVIIATPNGVHALQACASLRAGKHVIVEKPLALSKTSAREILEVANAQGKRVFPVLQIRCSQGASWLKGMIEAQRLGDLNLVTLDCFWNRDERYYRPGSWHGSPDLDGGVLFTQFSHFVDLLHWLFGNITDIRSHFNGRGYWSPLEDTGTVQFRFEKGGIGCFNFSTAVWDKNMDSSLSILGERGSVRVRGQYLETLDYCHVLGEMPPFPPPASAEDYHRCLIWNVIDVLKGRAEALVDGEDATASVEIIEHFYASK